jgi:hypothetical protein
MQSGWGVLRHWQGREIELRQEHKFTREGRERRIEDGAFPTGAAGGGGTLPLLSVGED